MSFEPKKTTTQTPGRYPFKVRAYETDANNRLKISSVFNFMQVAAGLNANQLGFGYDQLTPKGYFWVLSRVILEWNGNVNFDEEIIIETWPKGVEKLFALRDFRFYNIAEVCLGKATTAWLMMDGNTGRPMMLNSSMFNLPHFDIPPAVDELPGKIADQENMMLSGSRTALYSDIDVNQHVNNAKYLEYIFDAIPTDELIPFKNCRVQINYLKELKPGETVSIYVSRAHGSENILFVEARKDDNIKVFQSKLEFEPEQ